MLTTSAAFRQRKAVALKQDHQDKLSFHSDSLLLTNAIEHGHNLKLLAWPKRQNHAPVNGIITEGNDLWLSFLGNTFPITSNTGKTICFHHVQPLTPPYRLLKPSKEQIAVVNFGFKLETMKSAAAFQEVTTVVKLAHKKVIGILTGLDLTVETLK